MTGRDLAAAFDAAVSNVRQAHLDRLRAVGVAPATIAQLGSVYPAFGVLRGTIGHGGTFERDEGPAHVVQPVLEHGELVDLVAWRPDRPQVWGMVSGLGWMLNADACFASRWDGGSLMLHGTPLGWLQSGAVGGVVLDWASPDLVWLRGFDRIDTGDDMLAATLRRALAQPTRFPAIRKREIRHAA